MSSPLQSFEPLAYEFIRVLQRIIDPYEANRYEYMEVYQDLCNKNRIRGSDTDYLQERMDNLDNSITFIKDNVNNLTTRQESVLRSDVNDVVEELYNLIDRRRRRPDY